MTIPPAGWIDVAHRHGTRVLGTFITEWDKGYDVCEWVPGVMAGFAFLRAPASQRRGGKETLPNFN